ncbi:hypothetical protein TSUD_323280 [Trifolium subterraneum]|uniref:Uncharacterized protein n=1 Tax=Trifolium subterraneum TaxID=3900 RepID=A0A2Z6NM73_TRISU|nr:hypothetical protein TSUD_323280 [Trifolium subterraneum]
MPSSPSTSSADESLLSAEIQGVQSKPFGPQATATSTKSFDSGQLSVGGNYLPVPPPQLPLKMSLCCRLKSDGVQSKPFSPQATATLTQSFDLGQLLLRKTIAMRKVFNNTKSADNRLKLKIDGIDDETWEKCKKTPLKPRRPTTAFFLFMQVSLLKPVFICFCF